ncbi:MAG: hypothetical protein QW594_00050 [Candidatus Woesearchaeota archaeon]
MKKTNILSKIGTIAFIVGVVLALIAGLWGLSDLWIAVLVLAGLIVGFLNVTADETNQFVLMTVAIIIVASLAGTMLGVLGWIGTYLKGVFNAVVTFITPATIVVALKAIYAIAKDE